MMNALEKEMAMTWREIKRLSGLARKVAFTTI
jgi:hypothetical protein